MSRPYIVTIKKSDTFRVYDPVAKTFADMNKLPSCSTISNFYVSKGYKNTDEGMIQYANDFATWVKELKNNKIMKIIYDKYYNHASAIECTFKRLAKGKYEYFDPIDHIESSWMEKCFNTGIMQCKPGTYDSYGYDFSSFYPTILASENFQIPTKKGKEVLLKTLAIPSKLQVGYYHVKITCTNENFRKVFSFSKQNVYTHLSLKQALEFQNQFDVKIELVQDGKPNSYLYEKRDLTTGADVFGQWFDKLVQLRKLYPKNGLLKNLGSSLWGHLCRSNLKLASLDEINSENLDVGLDASSRYLILEHVTKTKNDYYELWDTQQPYCYSIRLKAFLPAFGRNKIAEVVMMDIDNCIRIQTDGVAFKKEQNFEYKFDKLLPDAKTTGRIQWNHVNSYSRLAS